LENDRYFLKRVQTLIFRGRGRPFLNVIPGIISSAQAENFRASLL
jgi:hypothetical protein